VHQQTLTPSLLTIKSKLSEKAIHVKQVIQQEMDAKSTTCLYLHRLNQSQESATTLQRDSGSFQRKIYHNHQTQANWFRKVASHAIPLILQMLFVKDITNQLKLLQNQKKRFHLDTTPQRVNGWSQLLSTRRRASHAIPLIQQTLCARSIQAQLLQNHSQSQGIKFKENILTANGSFLMWPMFRLFNKETAFLVIQAILQMQFARSSNQAYQILSQNLGLVITLKKANGWFLMWPMFRIFSRETAFLAIQAILQMRFVKDLTHHLLLLQKKKKELETIILQANGSFLM